MASGSARRGSSRCRTSFLLATRLSSARITWKAARTRRPNRPPTRKVRAPRRPSERAPAVRSSRVSASVPVSHRCVRLRVRPVHPENYHASKCALAKALCAPGSEAHAGVLSEEEHERHMAEIRAKMRELTADVRRARALLPPHIEKRAHPPPLPCIIAHRTVARYRGTR